MQLYKKQGVSVSKNEIFWDFVWIFLQNKGIFPKEMLPGKKHNFDIGCEWRQQLAWFHRNFIKFYPLF